MEGNQALALAGPLSYFALTILLLSVIAKSLNPKKLAPLPPVAVVYGILSVASFIHTFTCKHFIGLQSAQAPFWTGGKALISDIQQWSYDNYFQNLPYTMIGSPVELMSHWLMNTSVFKEAWVHATDSIFKWWWLENLCIYTAGTWTVFLVSEGKRKSVPYLWAYMIIAQVVAVSTASSLFFLALSLRAAEPKPPKPIPSKKNDDDINSVLPPSEIEAEVSAQTIIPILLGLFTISIFPAPASPDFLPVILALHGLLLIPVLPLPFQTSFPQFLNMPTITVYFAVTALSLVLRMQSTLVAAVSLQEVGILEFATAALEVLRSHPAMQAFGWDTVWSTVAFLIWNTLGDGSSEPKLQSLIPVVTSTAALGVSFSAPLALGNVIDEVFTQSDVKETPVT